MRLVDGPPATCKETLKQVKVAYNRETEQSKRKESR